MVRSVWLAVILTAVSASGAAAQPGAGKLALIFHDVFGPKGLAVNSEAVLPDGSTHSAHFNSAFQSNVTRFNLALASQLTSLPLPSPASGFTYAFDTGTGTFVRSTQSYGPILTDRAETIGRGKLSFGYNVQFFSFDTIEGLDLSSIPAVFTHDDYQLGGGRADVVTTANAIEASVTQTTAVFTYGITDRFDVSLATPVVRTRLSVRSTATIERVGTGEASDIHFFRDPDAPGGFGTQRQFLAEGTAVGLGDLIIRAKGTVMREGHRALAAGVDVRLPSGDEKDLLGAGTVGIKPFAALSLSFARVSPHVNVAYQWNGSSALAGDVVTGRKAPLPDQLVYAVGADVGVNRTFSLAFDVLGQLVIDSPRIVRRTFTEAGPDGLVSFADIGFETGTFSILNGAAGFKVNIARRVLATFNLRFRLGRNGLVDRVSPLIGLEYGF
jgi:hypothetical protein